MRQVLWRWNLSAVFHLLHPGHCFCQAYTGAPQGEQAPQHVREGPPALHLRLVQLWMCILTLLELDMLSAAD